MKKWLTVSDAPSHKPIIGRWADISDSGLIDGETPIEDYPFWLVTDTEISKGEAWDKWMEVLTEREDFNINYPTQHGEHDDEI